MKYPYLNLTDWPFRIVPNELSCAFMGDRSQLRSEVKTLLTNLSSQPTSSIHLMWAWFGAGKTHTLRHIEYLCKSNINNLIPIYMEFPRSVKGFIDIYKSFISKIDSDIIDEAYVTLFADDSKEKIQKELKCNYPDLAQALQMHYQGREEQQDIVIRWLRAECREVKILKMVGILKPIQTVEDAIKIITWLVKLININNSSSGKIKRVLWMLDEFQLIEHLRRPAIEEINSCLHSIFNCCPDSLSMIISFSGYPEQKKLPEWLSPEMKDRLDKKPFLLPPLSKDEASIFIKDVLIHFRDNSTKVPDEYFPFTHEAAQTIIKIIIDTAKKNKRHDEPKPRTLMQFFNMVLQEAEPLIKDGKIKIIDNSFVSCKLEGISLPE